MKETNKDCPILGIQNGSLFGQFVANSRGPFSESRIEKVEPNLHHNVSASGNNRKKENEKGECQWHEPAIVLH